MKTFKPQVYQLTLFSSRCLARSSGDMFAVSSRNFFKADPPSESQPFQITKISHFNTWKKMYQKKCRKWDILPKRADWLTLIALGVILILLDIYLFGTYNWSARISQDSQLAKCPSSKMLILMLWRSGHIQHLRNILNLKMCGLCLPKLLSHCSDIPSVNLDSISMLCHYEWVIIIKHYWDDEPPGLWSLTMHMQEERRLFLM